MTHSVFPLRLAAAAAAAVLMLSTAVAAPALADDDDHIAARQAMQRGEILPLPRILTAAQAAAPGDVIEVELDRHHGAWLYEVKILTSTGRVLEVKLTARTAVVLEIEED